MVSIVQDCRPRSIAIATKTSSNDRWIPFETIPVNIIASVGCWNTKSGSNGQIITDGRFRRCKVHSSQGYQYIGYHLNNLVWNQRLPAFHYYNPVRRASLSLQTLRFEACLLDLMCPFAIRWTTDSGGGFIGLLHLSTEEVRSF